jgi:hypothetical protein
MEEVSDQQTPDDRPLNLPREDQGDRNVDEHDETLGLLVGSPREQESSPAHARRWLDNLKWVIPFAMCTVIVGGILNFMVCLVLYVQDYDLFKDIRGVWNPSNCTILLRACSCTCCMLQPIVPCRCYGRKSCSLLCPITDPQPPLDASCSVPGRVVQSMDSYWGPGQPSCFQKYHRSALVEYRDVAAPEDLVVAAAYEVGPHGRRRKRGRSPGRAGGTRAAALADRHGAASARGRAGEGCRCCRSFHRLCRRSSSRRSRRCSCCRCSPCCRCWCGHSRRLPGR